MNSRQRRKAAAERHNALREQAPSAPPPPPGRRAREAAALLLGAAGVSAPPPSDDAPSVAQMQALVAALKHDSGSWHADPHCGIVWGGPGTIGDGRICDIRGWGHLTGTGGLGLSAEEAAATQDARQAFIAATRLGVPFLLAEIERRDAAIAVLQQETRDLARRVVEKGVALIEREQELAAERKAGDEWHVVADIACQVLEHGNWHVDEIRNDAVRRVRCVEDAHNARRAAAAAAHGARR